MLCPRRSGCGRRLAFSDCAFRATRQEKPERSWRESLTTDIFALASEIANAVGIQDLVARAREISMKAELNNAEEVRGSDVAAALSSNRHKYIVPSLSRYGTLADLTRANGTKNGNDSAGPGNGCGVGFNFLF